LQERGGATNFTHGALQMKFKLDNEFELVFVVSFLCSVHLEQLCSTQMAY